MSKIKYPIIGPNWVIDITPLRHTKYYAEVTFKSGHKKFGWFKKKKDAVKFVNHWKDR